MQAIINALIGAAALFFGRPLFWLFVGAAGFVLGFNAATEFLGDQAAWVIIVVALVVGLLGAGLAILLQRVAIGIAGFIAGGYLLLNITNLIGLTGNGDGLSLLAIVLYVVVGIVGVILVEVLFDVALIVLSASLGAGLLLQSADQWFAMEQTVRAILFFVLLVVGIGVQWATWQRRTVAEVDE